MASSFFPLNRAALRLYAPRAEDPLAYVRPPHMGLQIESRLRLIPDLERPFLSVWTALAIRQYHALGEELLSALDELPAERQAALGAALEDKAALMPALKASCEPESNLRHERFPELARGALAALWAALEAKALAQALPAAPIARAHAL